MSRTPRICIDARLDPGFSGGIEQVVIGLAKGLSALTDSFAKLGLSPEMVNKYTDVILDFVQSEAGQQTMSMLKSAA